MSQHTSFLQHVTFFGWVVFLIVFTIISETGHVTIASRKNEQKTLKGFLKSYLTEHEAARCPFSVKGNHKMTN